MTTTTKSTMREVMQVAWQFVRRYGFTMSEALKTAWRNIKLRAAMRKGIVKFYYQKVDGTLREAYGTLKESLVPALSGNDSRKKSDTVQTYYDTEKESWRCFKRQNLVRF
jgi:hypothetical protein|nr:MAG TPA: hypothetical protein [Caudoviricetes sp.]